MKKQGSESEITLDPGKYYPKYEIVQRRYPIAFLGQQNIEESKTNFKNKIKLNKKIENNKIIPYDDLAEREAYKKIRKEIKEEERKNKNKKIKLNDHYKSNSFNNYFNSDMKIDYKTIIPLYPINYLRRNRDSNTVGVNKKKLYKVSSAENINKIKCPINFNRMPGRDRKVVVEPNFNEVDYSPNFEVIRPHVPSTLFKHTFDCQKFKKYMTGKIIRSYCYTPDKYFVFEINQNKNKNNTIIYK